MELLQLDGVVIFHVEHKRPRHEVVVIVTCVYCRSIGMTALLFALSISLELLKSDMVIVKLRHMTSLITRGASAPLATTITGAVARLATVPASDLLLVTLIVAFRLHALIALGECHHRRIGLHSRRRMGSPSDIARRPSCGLHRSHQLYLGL
jgi:cellobiose-specific phosphotransferase system component IIC